jgi:hypothetical protein
MPQRGHSRVVTPFPTLIPQFDPVQMASSTQYQQDPDSLIAARVNATVTVTVGATITNGDTVKLVFTSAVFGGGSYTTATYTVKTGDTTASIAEALASIINADVILGFYDVEASTGIDTVAHESIVTIKWPGPLGNLCTVSASTSASPSETYTFSNSGLMSSGAGAVIPLDTFAVNLGGSLFQMYGGTPFNPGATRDLYQMVKVLPKLVLVTGNANLGVRLK